jgi:hypothetical protein
MRLVRKVVDSNMLRTDALDQYLSRSRGNVAVLTEFVLLEAQKTNPQVTLPGSTEILGRYADQVAVLRTSQDLLGLRGRSAGLQRRLIDARKTAEFPAFCRDARLAGAGDAQSQKRIGRTAYIASTHIDNLIAAAPSITAHFQHHSSRFDAAELRAIRQRAPYSPQIQVKLIDAAFESSAELANATGAIRHPLRIDEIVNLPVFRYCLCMTLLLTRWIAGGRQTRTKAAAVANDVVDANIAAYATYFDGVLSADRKLQSLHQEARHVLREIGANVPE